MNPLRMIRSAAIRSRFARLLLLILAFTAAYSPVRAAIPPLFRVQAGLSVNNISLIINDLDPLSQQIGNYYQNARKVPAENLIHIRFETGQTVISPAKFQEIMKIVRNRTPESVQAYVLTWNTPYRVGCMSVTTAFAAGYNESFCAKGCNPTLTSPYYNSKSGAPYSDYGWRPTIMLAGRSFESVTRLIDRGVASDHTYPIGKAYLLSTSDKARNSRAHWFNPIKQAFKNLWDVEVIQADSIRNRSDVMFYFTGLTRVPDIRSNRFLPGALADHLTSTGGKLTDSRQMSILEWLEAGATGSYGTVVEPCNFPQKFPNPGIVMSNYLRGSTLIEAYWKSVAWPGQGIFVGEPLAKPFGGP